VCGLFAYVDASNQSNVPFETGPVFAALKRRGPDGSAALHLPGCSLLHTRLAILDPKRGHQPMRHEQSGVAIAYNGEVYNAPEVRDDLRSRGYKFRTTTDTEVVLAAFVEYGQACVAMFEGMFAYAIWDPREQCLHVARDRMGEKPLYFARLPNGAIMVASEIKAFLAAGIEPTLNFDAIDHYLKWKYTPINHTIYKEIEIVPPGHSMVFRSMSITRCRYWRLPSAGAAHKTREQAVDELHYLLSTSVCRRLQSDRNVGLFLSGGIDSTILGVMAATESNKQLASFTVAYGADFDESPRAAAIAKRLGIAHATLPVRAFVPEDLEDVCAYLDQPHADSANLAQALLTQRASEQVRVVLSGDGADELFCGYRWYDKPTSLQHRHSQMTIFPQATRRRLLQHTLGSDRREQEKYGHTFDAISTFDLSHYLGGQLLPKADMLGMMYGVELRAPFLDFRIVEFAHSLPAEIKVGAEGKPLLRDLHRRILTDLPPSSRKQGFGPPLLEYLSEPRFRSYVLDRLGKGARIRDILDGKELDCQVQAAVANLDRQSAYRIWVLLCFELWASAWWK
jgi:asparagine synthase (glutamine-hydrolysing)